MDDYTTSTHSSGGFMTALFFIIVIWAVFGGGLFGQNARAAGYDNCSGTSNCDVEKQTIINTATTQNLIQVEGEKTRDANAANTQRLYDQAARQYEAGLQERIFDLKISAQTDAILRQGELNAKDTEIAMLKQSAYLERRFDDQSAALQALACELPKRPPYFAQGFVTTGTTIPRDCCGNAL